jgi:predicted lipoprotein with Yx(FWY)xxD motif
VHTNPRTRVSRAATLVLLAVVSASCGTTEDATRHSAAPSSPSATATGVPQRQGTTITSADSDFGQVLWGTNRQAIYIWQREPSTTPKCYDDCAEAWPPVLTTGDPVADGEVDATLLGTTTRRDGSTQVTYNGHPLYYYAHEGPGEVRCHNVATHGGLWWVITPAGERAR